KLLVGARPGVAGAEDGVEVAVEQLRAGDQGGDLLLLDHLPVDELLNIWMIQIENHHLCGAARRPARFNGSRGTVTDLEEAHQSAGLAAARQRLTFATQGGEI